MLRILVVFSCLAVSLTAHADDRQKAKEHFAEGKKLYDQGDYSGAVSEYEKSYAIAKLPLLRFNIAQAHRLNGDAELALENYRAFVEADPESPYVAESKTWIDKLEKELAEKEEKERQAKEAEAKKREEEARKRREAELRKIELENSRSRKLSTLGYAGIGATSVGVGLVGVGIYFGMKAKSAESDINSEDTMWSDALLDKFDEGESHKKKAYIFTGVGAGLALAGAAMLAYDLMESRGSTEDGAMVFAPTVTDDLAGMAIAGRF